MKIQKTFTNFLFSLLLTCLSPLVVIGLTNSDNCPIGDIYLKSQNDIKQFAANCEALSFIINNVADVNITEKQENCGSNLTLQTNCNIGSSLVGNYNLTTQTDVDIFVNSFSHYDTLLGSLFITNEDIIDLSSLSFLTHISGDLSILNANNLVSLKGFENVSTLGGNLLLEQNSSIISLEALVALKNIGGNLNITGLHSITRLNGLEQLRDIRGNVSISNNDLLDNIEAISEIDSISGFLSIERNYSLTDCKIICQFSERKVVNDFIYLNNNDLGCADLSEVVDLCSGNCPNKFFSIRDQSHVDRFVNAYNGCDTLFGTLSIDDYFFITQDPINNISALSFLKYITEDLVINNTALTSLDGLQHLEGIGGGVYLDNNKLLRSIDALGNITTIGNNIILESNPNLSDCQVLCALEKVTSSISVFGNGVGCQNQLQVQASCSDGSCPTGDFEFSTQEDLLAFATAYNTCDSIMGSIHINSSITDLTPLTFLVHIGGDLSIESNENITTLFGLQNIQSIGGSLYLNSLSIPNLNGLNALNSISGSFNLDNLFALENLEGLDSLESVGVYFNIYNNESLTNIDALTNLVSVNGSLNISYNPILGECELICSFEEKGIVKDYINLDNNGFGCRSYEETKKICEGNSCPNGFFYLTTQSEIDRFAQIYNNCDTLYGSLIMDSGFIDPIWDLSSLSFIKYISEGLQIRNNINITSLKGLENLEGIGNSFVLEGNDNLITLEPLEQLSYIGQILLIFNNIHLEDISVFNHVNFEGNILEIQNNPNLSNCEALCTFLDFAKQVIIKNNKEDCENAILLQKKCSKSACPKGVFVLNSQEEIDLFGSTFIGCDSLMGSLRISNNTITNLNSLSFLQHIDGDLEIFNTEITSLDGLEQLKAIGGGLSILNNHSLLDLTALNQVTSIKNTCRISNNTQLKNCQIMCSLLDNKLHPDSIFFEGNNFGCRNTKEVIYACNGSNCAFGDFFITSQSELKDFAVAYQNCDSLFGDLHIEIYEPFVDLSSLEFLTFISGNLVLTNNFNLSTLAGLENLHTIGGYLLIGGNDNLTSIAELQKLNSLNGDFVLVDNFKLEDCIGVCSLLKKVDQQVTMVTIQNNGEDCFNTIYDCHEETEKLASQLFQNYTFLSSLVDIDNCNTDRVTLYLSPLGIEFLLIENEQDTTLYNSVGELYCNSTPSLDCVTYYDLTNKIGYWECGIDITDADQDGITSDIDIYDTNPCLPNNEHPNCEIYGGDIFPQLFEKYNWLITVFDPFNCKEGSIQEYHSGGYVYLLIETSNDTYLYNGVGELYCTNSLGYTCTDFYPIDNSISIWNCVEEIPEIFMKYSWLEDYINPLDCSIEMVTIYNEDGNKYINIETTTSVELFTASGYLLCTSSLGYDCPTLYGFEDAEEVWQCNNIQSSRTFSSFQLPNETALSRLDFSVYPNPSSGRFNVVFKNDWESPSTIRIYDLQGKTIQQFDLNTFTDFIEIDLSQQARGIYSIQILSKNAVLSRRLVIQD